jgi:hypothetical protein
MVDFRSDDSIWVVVNEVGATAECDHCFWMLVIKFLVFDEGTVLFVQVLDL